MAHNIANETVINKIVNKYKIDKELVTKIVNSQFDYLREEIKSGRYNVVRLPYFGKFMPMYKKIHFRNKIRGMTPEEVERFKLLIKTGKYFKNGRSKSENEKSGNR